MRPAAPVPDLEWHGRPRRPLSISGIGYQGRRLADVLDELRSTSVTVLVDVRLRPLSRKAGMSKTSLAAAASARGVEYLHLVELGNPKDNRAAFADVAGEAGRGARERYARILQDGPGAAAVDRLAQLGAQHVVALLCFEADESTCHRALVLDAVRGHAGC